MLVSWLPSRSTWKFEQNKPWTIHVPNIGRKPNHAVHMKVQITTMYILGQVTSLSDIEKRTSERDNTGGHTSTDPLRSTATISCKLRTFQALMMNVVSQQRPQVWRNVCDTNGPGKSATGDWPHVLLCHGYKCRRAVQIWVQHTCTTCQRYNLIVQAMMNADMSVVCTSLPCTCNMHHVYLYRGWGRLRLFGQKLNWFLSKRQMLTGGLDQPVWNC